MTNESIKQRYQVEPQRFANYHDLDDCVVIEAGGEKWLQSTVVEDIIQ